MAHAVGVTVEGEPGCPARSRNGEGGEEDGWARPGNEPRDQLLTDPRPGGGLRQAHRRRRAGDRHRHQPWRLQVHPQAHRRHPRHRPHQGRSTRMPTHPGDASVRRCRDLAGDHPESTAGIKGNPRRWSRRSRKASRTACKVNIDTDIRLCDDRRVRSSRWRKAQRVRTRATSPADARAGATSANVCLEASAAPGASKIKPVALEAQALEWWTRPGLTDDPPFARRFRRSVSSARASRSGLTSGQPRFQPTSAHAAFHEAHMAVAAEMRSALSVRLSGSAYCRSGSNGCAGRRESRPWRWRSWSIGSSRARGRHRRPAHRLRMSIRTLRPDSSRCAPSLRPTERSSARAITGRAATTKRVANAPADRTAQHRLAILVHFRPPRGLQLRGCCPASSRRTSSAAPMPSCGARSASARRVRREQHVVEAEERMPGGVAAG